MSIALTVLPDGIKVAEMKGENEQGEEVITRMLSLVDGRSGITVNVGPFDSGEWDSWLAYLQDPEGETARQQAREKIAVVSGGTPLPKMDVPKG